MGVDKVAAKLGVNNWIGADLIVAGMRRAENETTRSKTIADHITIAVLESVVSEYSQLAANHFSLM